MAKSGLGESIHEAVAKSRRDRTKLGSEMNMTTLHLTCLAVLIGLTITAAQSFSSSSSSLSSAISESNCFYSNSATVTVR